MPQKTSDEELYLQLKSIMVILFATAMANAFNGLSDMWHAE